MGLLGDYGQAVHGRGGGSDVQRPLGSTVHQLLVVRSAQSLQPDVPYMELQHRLHGVGGEPGGGLLGVLRDDDWCHPPCE